MQCTQEQVLASIEFINIMQNKYNLVSSLNQIQHSSCQVEELNHKIFYIYKIEEFYDKQCELRIVLNKENYLIPDPISEFQDEIVNYKLLEEDDFLITNPEQNCIILLEKESQTQKLDRVEKKIEKDIKNFAKSLGTAIVQRGQIIFASFIHGDQQKFDMSLFQFFAQEINYFYNDSIIRYKNVFLDIIPKNKEQILQFLKEEFQIQKQKMEKQWANSAYNFVKKLSNQIIHYLTGVSNNKLEFVENVMEKTFPNLKQQSIIIIKTIIEDIENILHKIFAQNQVITTATSFFREKVQQIAQKLNIYEGRVIEQFYKNCTKLDISNEIIVYLLQTKTFRSQIYFENYINCTQEEHNIYTLIFQINNMQCLIKVKKGSEFEIISEQNEDCRSIGPDSYDFKIQINKEKLAINLIVV